MDQRNVDFWAYAQGFVRTVDLERLMGDPFFLPMRIIPVCHRPLFLQLASKRHCILSLEIHYSNQFPLFDGSSY